MLLTFVLDTTYWKENVRDTFREGASGFWSTWIIASNDFKLVQARPSRGLKGKEICSH